MKRRHSRDSLRPTVPGGSGEPRSATRRGLLLGGGAWLARGSVAGAAGALLSLPSHAATPQELLARMVDLRFGMFNHFNMGTFTNEEWATPNQNPTVFAPTDVNCAQWAEAARAAGMRFGVLTTKHHDGFCLWPTKTTYYSVANSGYRQDVVRQYVDAFRAAGLRVGLYFSIWDRTNGVIGRGSNTGQTEAIQPTDMTYILAQLTELLTQYGAIDMLVTDGWAWQMGQQAVSYQTIRAHVKSLQPDIVMTDHGALSEPFLGDAIMFEEPFGITAPAGNTYAAVQGQTISNGWFWHPSTPTEALMSRSAILSHLSDLQPRYTTFLLNCPPNRAGRLDDNIVRRLREVGAAYRPAARAPLPPQPLRVEHPINPVNAYATRYHYGEGPLNAIDGLSNKDFESCWSTYGWPLPQSLTIDLGGHWSNVSTLEYLPKQWRRTNRTDGDITNATIEISTDGNSFTPVATVNWAGNGRLKVAEWPACNAAYVRITVTGATGGYANIGGLHIGGRIARPVLLSRPFPVSGGTYRLVNRNSGQVADVYNLGKADGTNVMQYPWWGGANQTWRFTSVGDGYWVITDTNSGKVLDAGLTGVDGGNVVVWTNNQVAQQNWAVTAIGGGFFILTSRYSGLALTVSRASLDKGANIDQWTYINVPNQEWMIVPV